LGYGLLRVLTSKISNNKFCVSLPNNDVSTVEALCVEFIITSVLILVCCGVWDPRNAKHHGELNEEKPSLVEEAF
jgi:aquaporin rerated protein, invertebrate